MSNFKIYVFVQIYTEKPKSKKAEQLSLKMVTIYYMCMCLIKD